jgi:hypothetical protein
MVKERRGWFGACERCFDALTVLPFPPHLWAVLTYRSGPYFAYRLKHNGEAAALQQKSLRSYLVNSWTGNQKISMLFQPAVVPKLYRGFIASEKCFMDMTTFLKMVPAAIGLAGFLAYLTRAQKPTSDIELVNIVQSVRSVFVLLGCLALIMLSVWLIYRPAPPDTNAGPLDRASTCCSELLPGQAKSS